jgi:ribose-phosphate pyrophosphokinase
MIDIRDGDYKVLTFSGGEQHVQLKAKLGARAHEDGVLIHKRIQSSKDVMDLLLLVDILRGYRISKIALSMPYIPYARQDRRTEPTTSQSLKVFASLINSCNFEFVNVVDPHSMVAENLINNMVAEPVSPYLRRFLLEIAGEDRVEGLDVVRTLDLNNIVLVSPDAGAIKKIESYAKELKIPNIVAFHKERDPATGDIKNIKCISGDKIWIKDKHVFVVDDICDGGRTFIEMLKAYPAFLGVSATEKPKSLNLFVTHGIFSQGLRPLLAGGFTNIGSTNSFKSSKIGPDDDIDEDYKKLTIIPLNTYQERENEKETT